MAGSRHGADRRASRFPLPVCGRRLAPGLPSELARGVRLCVIWIQPSYFPSPWMPFNRTPWLPSTRANPWW